MAMLALQTPASRKNMSTPLTDRLPRWKTTWQSASVSGRVVRQFGTCTRSGVGVPVNVSSRTLIALVQAT